MALLWVKVCLQKTQYKSAFGLDQTSRLKDFSGVIALLPQWSNILKDCGDFTQVVLRVSPHSTYDKPGSLSICAAGIHFHLNLFRQMIFSIYYIFLVSHLSVLLNRVGGGGVRHRLKATCGNTWLRAWHMCFYIQVAFGTHQMQKGQIWHFSRRCFEPLPLLFYWNSTCLWACHLFQLNSYFYHSHSYKWSCHVVYIYMYICSAGARQQEKTDDVLGNSQFS